MLAVIIDLVSVEMIVSLGGFVKLLASSPSFILFLSSLVKSKATSSARIFLKLCQ